VLLLLVVMVRGARTFCALRSLASTSPRSLPSCDWTLCNCARSHTFSSADSLLAAVAAACFIDASALASSKICPASRFKCSSRLFACSCRIRNSSCAACDSSSADVRASAASSFGEQTCVESDPRTHKGNRSDRPPSPHPHPPTHTNTQFAT
jgi:hypothetical protein